MSQSQSTVQTNKAQQALKVIAETVAALEQRRSELGTQVAAANAEMERLFLLPVHRDELRALLMAAVDDAAASFPERAGWRNVLGAFAGPAGKRPQCTPPEEGFGAFPSLQTQRGPFLMRDLAFITEVPAGAGGRSNRLRGVLGADLAALTGSGSEVDPAMDWARLCFFFGDVVKQKLHAHFEQVFSAIQDRSIEAALGRPMQTAEDSAVVFTKIGELRESVGKLEAEIAAIDAELAQLPRNDRKDRVSA